VSGCLCHRERDCRRTRKSSHPPDPALHRRSSVRLWRGRSSSRRKRLCRGCRKPAWLGDPTDERCASEKGDTRLRAGLGLLGTTQQVGGSLGLAILSSIATSRTTSALHAHFALPAALTHGFKGSFIVAGVLGALGSLFAIALLPGRPRESADEHAEVVALSFARCPGAPYCGRLARVVALGRRMRGSLARPQVESPRPLPVSGDTEDN
jgi:hypothetical protein